MNLSVNHFQCVWRACVSVGVVWVSCLMQRTNQRSYFSPHLLISSSPHLLISFTPPSARNHSTPSPHERFFRAAPPARSRSRSRSRYRLLRRPVRMARTGLRAPGCGWRLHVQGLPGDGVDAERRDDRDHRSARTPSSEPSDGGG